jgi:glucose-1-phosphate thymidylyltransferase
LKAVILAGGRGKRLRPITDKVAKGLLPVQGRPLIEQILKNLYAVGIREFIIVTGHLGWQISDYLGDGSQLGGTIIYVEQKEQLGSAHALLTAGELIVGDVLVSACDSIFPEKHYRELIEMFKEEELDIALSLKIMNDERIKESSVVKMKEDGTILQVIEKPSEDEIISNISCGPVYIFKDIIKDYLKRVKKSKRGEYELPDAIQMMIDDGFKIKGLVSKSWIHLSNIQDFLELNFGYLRRYLT